MAQQSGPQQLPPRMPSRPLLLPLLLCLLLPLCLCGEQITRQCIKERSPVQFSKLCPAVDQACHNSLASMTVCLTLNQCYDANPAEPMSRECWHCWADLQVNSDLIKDFQTAIRKCWEWGYAGVLVFVLGLFVLA